MDISVLLGRDGFAAGSILWTPGLFALLLALAVGLLWMAFAPASTVRAVDERLDGYLDRGDMAGDLEMARPFAGRVLWPLLRRLIRFLGGLAPRRNAEKTRQMLLRAGEPGRMAVIDFFGLRILAGVFAGLAMFAFASRGRGFVQALIFAIIAAAIGYLLPQFWLGSRVRSRQHRIRRALPDALDMLTVGVEAGLAFESALLRVGEKMDNPLTREFRRVVAEMRVGTPREVALARMVDRTGVEDLNTFVAVLDQSTQLGVPIAHVLHEQAAQIRQKRRQRVEELARQAGVKMVFPLAFFILPAMFIVAIGPAAPRIVALFSTIAVSNPIP